MRADNSAHSAHLQADHLLTCGGVAQRSVSDTSYEQVRSSILLSGSVQEPQDGRICLLSLVVSGHPGCVLSCSPAPSNAMTTQTASSPDRPLASRPVDLSVCD